MAADTLVEVLRARAREHPGRCAYTFLEDGDAEASSCTYGELDARARAVGGLLQAAGAAGERILLLYPPGLDFVAGFFGALYAGAVAVPVHPPRFQRGLGRLRRLAEDARPAVVLTTEALLAKAGAHLARDPVLGQLRCLSTDAVPDGCAEEWRDPHRTSADTAFLQYTSGSTSDPKGVMVGHGNLLHNLGLIRDACRHSADSTFVTWLPPYHDLGLIGNLLQSAYVGARCVFMSPVAFLQAPRRWLAAVSRFGGTTSGGPNFGYELCARKIPSEQTAGLDLSRWQVA
ncbi:MAG TPA: AMP-binding protein, partial [Thermoanaerobaculia bacterium]|nr:AMP-binding protein [Thermoanaerobaculia bacterium]